MQNMTTQQSLLATEEMTGLPFLFILLAVAAVGAVIGSFLNVVIHRIPREESIAFPSSHCPSCGASLRPDEVEWLDDVTAECAYCGSPVRETN